jgi:hypothetical protein
MAKKLGFAVRVVVLGHLLFLAGLGIYAAETGAAVFKYMRF